MVIAFIWIFRVSGASQGLLLTESINAIYTKVSSSQSALMSFSIPKMSYRTDLKSWYLFKSLFHKAIVI